MVSSTKRVLSLAVLLLWFLRFQQKFFADPGLHVPAVSIPSVSLAVPVLNAHAAFIRASCHHNHRSLFSSRHSNLLSFFFSSLLVMLKQTLVRRTTHQLQFLPLLWTTRQLQSLLVLLRHLQNPVRANGMELDSEPAELSCLNALEQRLISLRVPFMKMVALPSGKQRRIHGPAVNVPSKIDCVCTMPPRLPSDCELVPLKLKRSYPTKVTICIYVSPQKLINALKWLKAQNPLYADIDIADDWVESAIADDEELVVSMLEQPENMEHDGNTDIAEVTNDDSANGSSSQPSDPVSHYTNVLKVFAREHGYGIHECA